MDYKLNNMNKNALIHHGVKGMKWGVIRGSVKNPSLTKDVVSKISNTKLSNISSDTIAKGAKFVAKNNQGIILPRKEYGHVLHEIRTHVEKNHGSSDIYDHIVGSYKYTVRNRPGDIPLIIAKNKILGRKR